jgi:hypothetical protein
MQTSMLEIIPTLDLTAEQKAQAMALFTDEKVRAKFEAPLRSAQAEFSRGMDEARTIKTKAEAEKDAYWKQMDTWRQNEQKKIDASGEVARKATESIVAWKTRLEALTARGEIDRELWEGVPEPPATTTPVAPDPQKYVTQEEGQQYLAYPGYVFDIGNKHLKLFGEPVPNMQELITKARAANGSKTIEQVWEETYNVPSVREERAKKAQEEHDQKIQRETEARVRSELLNPTARPVNANYNSPVLVAAAKTQQTNVIPNSGSRRGVENALAAHAAGKYADGVVHTVP